MSYRDLLDTLFCANLFFRSSLNKCPHAKLATEIFLLTIWKHFSVALQCICFCLSRCSFFLCFIFQLFFASFAAHWLTYCFGFLGVCYCKHRFNSSLGKSRNDLVSLFILFFFFKSLASLLRLLTNRWLALLNNSLVLARYKQLKFQAFTHEDLHTRAHAICLKDFVQVVSRVAVGIKKHTLFEASCLDLSCCK